MTKEERDELRAQLLGAKKVQTDSGTVEERSADEIATALEILDKLEAKTTADGRRRSQLGRLGFYGRNNIQ